MPPPSACAKDGPSSPEVTRAICLVPSAHFSQAPEYTQPAHLCRFRVRSYGEALSWNPHPRPPNPIRANKRLDPSLISRPTNVHVVPIGYAFRPDLRGRLTLRRLTLRRNPWTYGERVSHPLCRYSCQHSHFRYLQQTSQFTFTGLRNAPLPLKSQNTEDRDQTRLMPVSDPWILHSDFRTRVFGTQLEPRYIFGAKTLDQ